MAGRPSYVPDRLSYWPTDEGRANLSCTIREGTSSDVSALRSLLASAGWATPLRTIAKWLTQNAYTVRLVCRNLRHPVAACVTRTGPSGTRVLFLHVSPPFAGYNLDSYLLALACGELPERPTSIKVGQHDTTFQQRLRELGWKFGGTDGDDYLFTRQLFTALPAGGPEAAPAAGDDPG